MKFLLALTVLASTTVFAQRHHDKIKCYEPAQQGGRGELAYVLEERGEGDRVLHVVYPDDLSGPLKLDRETGCLEHPGNGPEAADPKDRLQLCEGEGQSIGRLVPIEATVGRDEQTVYCERAIQDWFDERDNDDNDEGDEDDK